MNSREWITDLLLFLGFGLGVVSSFTGSGWLAGFAVVCVASGVALELTTIGRARA